VNRSLRVIRAAGKIELHLPQEEGRSAERIRTYTDPLWWNPFKLLVAPIIEGAGPGSWHSMLRRTDLVIRKRKDDDYPTEGVPGTAASRWLRAQGRAGPGSRALAGFARSLSGQRRDRDQQVEHQEARGFERQSAMMRKARQCWRRASRASSPAIAFTCASPPAIDSRS